MFMSSALVNKNRSRDQKYVIERIAHLREELEDLTDYVDLLEARAMNLDKPVYSTEEVKKILKIR
jgi:hypothetical protein